MCNEYYGTEKCIFCDLYADILDLGCSLEQEGIVCGECMRRMGFDEELILPCGLCKFPVFEIHMVDEHSYEYCGHCTKLLCRAGFQETTFD